MANTNLATSQKQGITTFLSSEKVKQNIAQVVGEKGTTKFIASVVSAVQTNKTLQECTNASVLSAALLGEALKLTPSPQLGQYYMVPYNNKSVKEAQFQLGYKGYLQLAIRSGQYKKFVATEVKEGEIQDYNPITEEFTLNPILNEAERAKAQVTGYYAMFELMNGFRKEIYWSKEKMTEHAKKYSSGYRSDLTKKTSYTFWAKDFDSMAKKTMIRQLISKWGIMSIDMQTAFEKDMAVIDENGNASYVDNIIDVEETVQSNIDNNANTTEFTEIIEGEVVEENTVNADAKGTDEPDWVN